MGLFDLWVKLITLSGTFQLKNCELGFKTSDGFYVRNNPDRSPLIFLTTSELKKYYLSKKYISIEFGSVYPGKNREIEQHDENIIKQWPLVFDIDINDYDDQRTCKCMLLKTEEDRKTVCNDCWREFIIPAMNTMQDALTNIFMFKHVLILYSGRRGIHIWVLDKRVWSYTTLQRAIICQYFIKQKNIRLDKEVSISVKHLIKLPLVVHTCTKRRSIPIDNTFLPEDYPQTDDLDKYIKLIDEKI